MSRLSAITTPSEMLSIGESSGAISIDPMITATLSSSSPKVAISTDSTDSRKKSSRGVLSSMSFFTALFLSDSVSVLNNVVGIVTLWYNFARMLTNIFMIFAGFLLLIKGADYFVSGAASFSRKLGIPALVVGLTVISIGTSAPELFVNVIAAFRGATDLSIGNVLGSNLADILVGLGLAAMFVPLSVKSATLWKEIPFSLMAAVFILIFGSDLLLDGILPNAITRTDGLALLGMFVVFIVYTMGVKKSGEQPEEKIEVFPSVKTFWLMLSGVLALAVGGYVLVDGAVALARDIGISENLIGLTIVAIGTSLPEIITAVQAARKKHIDMAVGGIIGTIIFNASFVLGTTALLQPLPFSSANLFDALAVMVATLILFLLLYSSKRREIGKKEGAVFIVMYIAYIIFALLRG
jgi:cation:H+ antiporter